MRARMVMTFSPEKVRRSLPFYLLACLSLRRTWVLTWLVEDDSFNGWKDLRAEQLSQVAPFGQQPGDIGYRACHVDKPDFQPLETVKVLHRGTHGDAGLLQEVEPGHGAEVVRAAATPVE